MSIGTILYAPTNQELEPLKDLSAVPANQFEQTVGSCPMLALEGTWHGLHFMISGSPDPADGPDSFLLAGGKIVDLVESSARIFLPEEVKEIASALASISPQIMGDRLEPAKLQAAEVYPNVWNNSLTAASFITELKEEFTKLRHFVQIAALENRCLMVSNEWPGDINPNPVRQVTVPNWVGTALATGLAGLGTATFMALRPSWVTRSEESTEKLFDLVGGYLVCTGLLLAIVELLKWAKPSLAASRNRWTASVNSLEKSAWILLFSMIAVFMLLKFLG
ncbi:MAG TPA: hypothetical protein DCY13_13640 [Verrucomicrobiales bacterium]|nr:hypothetical protein [Verrucomicrobiales bacterium]